MTVYGKQADVMANQGRGVNLYIPGKTILKQGDIFLGGTGTGVMDQELNGATRVFGNTAEDTASAYGGYLKGSQSQSSQPALQPAFKLPPGARPTLAMRAQMASEDQFTKNYDLQQKTFDWGKARDEAAQKIDVGQMMGTYDGQDTLAKQAQAIQQAQFTASQAQNESQFGRSLAQDNYQFGANLNQNQSQFNAGNKLDWFNADTSRAGVTNIMPGTGGTVSGGSMPAEYSAWVNDAATKNGIPPAILAGLIEAESSWDPSNVNSVSGATGLGQFLKTTADDEGLSNRTDAQSSIYAAAAYLAKRIKWAGGDLEKGIMGYGEGTPEYLNRVLDKSKNYTVSAGTTIPSRSATKPSDSATVTMKGKIETALANGSTVDELLSGLNGDVEDGTARLKNYDVDYLRNFIESQRQKQAQSSTPSGGLGILQKYR